MPIPTIDDFVFDEDNIAKLNWHRVAYWQAQEVLDGPYAIIPNRRQRRAPYLVIGFDRAGRCLTIPIEPTHDPALWRPVTAWTCKPSERAVLERRRPTE